jgi:hypothetical protein
MKSGNFTIAMCGRRAASSPTKARGMRSNVRQAATLVVAVVVFVGATPRLKGQVILEVNLPAQYAWGLSSQFDGTGTVKESNSSVSNYFAANCTLLDPYHVRMAAHQLTFNGQATSIAVQFGTDVNNPMAYHTVNMNNIAIHPLYNPGGPLGSGYDECILTLNTPVTEVAPVGRYNGNITAGQYFNWRSIGMQLREPSGNQVFVGAALAGEGVVEQVGNPAGPQSFRFDFGPSVGGLGSGLQYPMNGWQYTSGSDIFFNGLDGGMVLGGDSVSTVVLMPDRAWEVTVVPEPSSIALTLIAVGTVTLRQLRKENSQFLTLSES